MHSKAYLVMCVTHLTHQRRKPTRRIIACSALLLAFASHAASDNLLVFPNHWGRPPIDQAGNYMRLPYGYGYGSSTLANWIETNAKLNRFPKDWGKPPNDVATDFVRLPENYGYGSSTLQKWILSKTRSGMKLDSAMRQILPIQEWRPYSAPSPKPSPSPSPVRKRPTIRVYAR